jgi:hypothetical protein
MNPEQLPPNSRHHLVFVLPSRREFLVLRVQPVLCFPGNLFAVLAEFEVTLALKQVPTQPWPMLVGLCRLDNQRVPILVINPVRMQLPPECFT